MVRIAESIFITESNRPTAESVLGREIKCWPAKSRFGQRNNILRMVYEQFTSGLKVAAPRLFLVKADVMFCVCIILGSLCFCVESVRGWLNIKDLTPSESYVTRR